MPAGHCTCLVETGPRIERRPPAETGLGSGGCRGRGVSRRLGFHFLWPRGAASLFSLSRRGSGFQMCDDASAASADVGSPPSVEPPFRDPLPPSRNLCCFVFAPLRPGESIAATSFPEQRTMMAYVERGLSPVGQRMIDSRTGGRGTGGCEGPSGYVYVGR